MEKLYELLENCCPNVDFRKEKALITDKIIDSMDLMSIISDIEDGFDISIEMDKIEAANFDSAEAIWNLVESLR
ncbi:MAG: acyl carrier protein [Oscillospiraceae bacterium]|nr:acyl carrier protein [Oscillospiraceae bacterium]